MKSSYSAMLFCFIALFASCKRNQESANLNQDSKKIRIKTVEVTKSTGGDLRFSGSIEPSKTIPLSFQSSGIVETIYVEEGDHVKKGQLLACLDKKDMNSLYQVTLSKYQQAKDAYDRLKTVHDQGSLTDIKWVEIETGYNQAKSSLDLAKNNLDKCDLRSPADGIIGKRNIEPGQSTLGVNMSQLELVELNTVYVKVSVPENEISQITKGLKASVAVAAVGNRLFEGFVNMISPVAETISRTYTIKISVNNKELELKPGMVCDVILNMDTDKEKIMIPYQCVSKDFDGQTFVFVVNSDRSHVKKQLIEAGQYYNDKLEVKSGLMKGDVVVLEGKEKLSDNSIIIL